MTRNNAKIKFLKQIFLFSSWTGPYLNKNTKKILNISTWSRYFPFSYLSISLIRQSHLKPTLYCSTENSIELQI